MIALALMLALQDTSRLALTHVVGRALAHYPTVAAARAARDRAGAEVGEAHAALRPRLVFDASVTQWQEPAIVYPLHGLPTGPSAELPPFDRTTLQGSAFLSWTLYDFGSRTARVRAQRELFAALDAAFGAAEQQLIARAATAYLRAFTARQTLAAQDQRLSSLEAEAERARRMLAEGVAARVEVLRAAALLARARADRSAAAGQLDVAERELAQLAALPFAAVHDALLSEPRLRDTAELDRDSLLTRALLSNPALAEARLRADAARMGVAAIRATRLPELRLATGVVDRGATGQQLRAEWQAGLAVSYPLYTGGQREGAIARAEAEARGAHEQRRLAELEVARNLDRAIAALVESRARVAALRSAVEQSEAVVEIERTSLEIGAGTQTDYLEAVTNLLIQRAAYIEARAAEITATIELARLTGDLTPGRLERIVESDR
jgi:outer membrane protein